MEWARSQGAIGIEDREMTGTRRESLAIDTMAEHLVDRFLTQLTAYAARKGSNDPEGAASTVLAETVVRLPDIRDHSEPALRSYLYRSLRRQLAREIEREQREEWAVNLLQIDARSNRSSAGLDGAAADLDLIADLLRQLTEDQRKVVNDRYVHGRPYGEIADELGKQPEAVRKIASRALVRMRVRLVALGLAAVAMVALLLSVWNDDSTLDTSPIDDSEQQHDEAPSTTTPGPRPDPGRSSVSTPDPDREQRQRSDIGSIETPVAPTPTTASAGSPPTTVAPSSTLPRSTVTASTTVPTSVSTSTPTTLPTTSARPGEPEAATPLMPVPDPPDACEVQIAERDSRGVEVHVLAGDPFAASYNLYDDDYQWLANTAGLDEAMTERDESGRVHEREWEHGDNPGFEPMDVYHVASVDTDGNESITVRCDRIELS